MPFNRRYLQNHSYKELLSGSGELLRQSIRKLFNYMFIKILFKMQID
ncbi:hypothetical protein BN439_2058 [Erwinia amylovora Ea644]|nr:hypothetical protein BN439_2058 [Erwinia amylovora Ea644]CCP07115.1 hypothetical protein BN440_2090 [Erwinia amylovora MR1]